MRTSTRLPSCDIEPAGPRDVKQQGLLERFRRIRATTTALAAPLTAEDCVAQSMPDASPVKWHLAHTAWFFEQFALQPKWPGYRVFHEKFAYLFNSYYEAVGPRHRRPERGLLTRPTLAEVMHFREHVDAAMTRLLERGVGPELAAIVELGLEHEQQHQELLLMDVKHLLSCNPLKPAYQTDEANTSATSTTPAPLEFHSCPEGIYCIGQEGEGFCFDSETPRHRVYVQAFELANRMVTNGEYLEFILDGGYKRPDLWLADGWTAVQTHSWRRPLYWSDFLDTEFSLAGQRELDLAAPVCHVSFYEADAFARWAQARLATEAEWEIIASRQPLEGNFLDSGLLRPRAATGRDLQLFGDAWEWTRSAYSPYPGFKPLTGALGEYNGKFMCNQVVLRGGSCVTAAAHVRATYRNYFYPHMRWQFSGIRLARDTRAA